VILVGKRQTRCFWFGFPGVFHSNPLPLAFVLETTGAPILCEDFVYTAPHLHTVLQLIHQAFEAQDYVQWGYSEDLGSLPAALAVIYFVLDIEVVSPWKPHPKRQQLLVVEGKGGKRMCRAAFLSGPMFD
jgi:hypothetical protein